MNVKTQFSHQRISPDRITFGLIGLFLATIVGCVPVSTQPIVQPTPSATEPLSMPTQPSPTATDEALIPTGWTTYTSQRCEYSISYPEDMQIWDESANSRTFGFKLDNPDEGARNFIYVSVINQEYPAPDGEGIYNYDPAEADLLLNMQVGESKASRDIPQVASSFTYQRLPDTTINGYAARTYENLKPWEFPNGTKEVRYYLSQNGCTYQIGGYLDTTQSNQPGAITEDLLHQILATIRVMP